MYTDRFGDPGIVLVDCDDDIDNRREIRFGCGEVVIEEMVTIYQTTAHVPECHIHLMGRFGGTGIENVDLIDTALMVVMSRNSQ